MARKKSATPKAKGTTPARPGRSSPALREPAADIPLASYAALLNDLKGRIRTAQVKANLAVNRVLLGLYWDIGQTIVERQKSEGWGKSIVDRLGADLQKEFPGESGFSPTQPLAHAVVLPGLQGQVTNLAQAVRDLKNVNLQQTVGERTSANLPQAVAEIPWGHNIALIEKLKDPAERLWSARQTTGAPRPGDSQGLGADPAAPARLGMATCTVGRFAPPLENRPDCPRQSPYVNPMDRLLEPFHKNNPAPLSAPPRGRQ